MKIYYTSTSQGEVQMDPRLSLGGYQSASEIPNNRLSTLFDQITLLSLSQEIIQDQYIGLILENDSEEYIEDVSFWFTINEDSFSEYSIAAVDLNDSGMMERITDRESMPFYAEFETSSDEESPISLGGMAGGAKLGLWICRHIKDDILDTVKADTYYYTPATEQGGLAVATTLDKVDMVQLNFSEV